MPMPCWLKHLCSIRAWVPVSFFLSLSLYFWLIPWSAEAAELTFLPGLLRPSREGALCLHPLERVPTCSSVSPKNRTLLAFRVNQGISASFSLLLSEPPGSSPLKDQHLTSFFFSLPLTWPLHEILELCGIIWPQMGPMFLHHLFTYLFLHKCIYIHMFVCVYVIYVIYIYVIIILYICCISSVQSLSHVQLFATPGTTARQASLSITNSQSLLKLMSTESVMPSNHLILCRPLLLPPSIIPSIRVFSHESILPIRWPKY